MSRTAICPECEAELALAANIMQNELIACPDCGADLEVLSLDPGRGRARARSRRRLGRIVMRIAVLVTHIRPEEKLLISAFQVQGVEPDIVLDRDLHFDINRGAEQLLPPTASHGMPTRS